MTKKQLDDANALVNRIERLRKVLNVFMSKAATMDESLVRMTEFDIVSDHGMRENINQGELLFLVEAYTNEIARLEEELAKV